MKRSLAIRGHRVRGKEVIQLLMMLGGVNYENFKGNVEKNCYYINPMKRIDWGDSFKAFTYTHDIFTLEEFLSKYPYKVGDKVWVEECESVYTISDMVWEDNEIKYRINTEDDWLTAVELQSYNEQESIVIKENFYDSPYTGSVRAEEQTYLNPKAAEAKEEIKENLKEAKTIMEETIKIDIPKGYEFVGVDDNNQQVVLERIKPQYPKTYEECCKVLGLIEDEAAFLGYEVGHKPYKESLIISFQKLLICRDAYWKIAGDWKPDWSDKTSKYVIVARSNDIVCYDTNTDYHSLLAFPTEEMCNTFYNNFKKLIEECIGLLQ